MPKKFLLPPGFSSTSDGPVIHGSSGCSWWIPFIARNSGVISLPKVTLFILIVFVRPQLWQRDTSSLTGRPARLGRLIRPTRLGHPSSRTSRSVSSIRSWARDFRWLSFKNFPFAANPLRKMAVDSQFSSPYPHFSMGTLAVTVDTDCHAYYTSKTLQHSNNF